MGFDTSHDVPLICAGVLGAVLLSASVYHFLRAHASYNRHRSLTVGVGVASMFTGVAQLWVLAFDLYDVRYLQGTYADELRWWYNGIAIASLALVLLLLPFLYVFDSDKFRSWRTGHDEHLSKWKAAVSFLFILPPLMIVAAIFFVSRLLDSDRGSSIDGANAQLRRYHDDVMHSKHKGDDVLRALISALGLVGVPFLVYYVPSGLGLAAAWFFKRFRTQGEVVAATERLEDDIDATDQSMQTIRRKYQSDLKLKIEDDDKAKFETRAKARKDLETTRLLVSQERTQESTFVRVLKRLAGIVFVLYVLAVCGSFGSGIAFRVIGSDCGFQCGFLTKGPAGWYNPADRLLSKTFPFPAALTLLSLTLLGVVVAVMRAFSALGLQFLCIAHDRFEPVTGLTTSQGVFMQSAMFLMITTTLTVLLPVVLPEYTVFAAVDGCSYSSYYVPGTVAPTLTLSNETVPLRPSDAAAAAAESTCKITALGQLSSELHLTRPLFNIAFVSVAFLLCILIALTLVWYLAQSRMLNEPGSSADQPADNVPLGRYVSASV